MYNIRCLRRLTKVSSRPTAVSRFAPLRTLLWEAGATAAARNDPVYNESKGAIDFTTNPTPAPISVVVDNLERSM